MALLVQGLAQPYQSLAVVRICPRSRKILHTAHPLHRPLPFPVENMKPKKPPAAVKHFKNNWPKLLPEEKEELLPVLQRVFDSPEAQEA